MELGETQKKVEWEKHLKISGKCNNSKDLIVLKYMKQGKIIRNDKKYKKKLI